MKTLNITERINFTFMLSADFTGELEDRVHNLLIKYYSYTITGHYITVKNILPMNIDFIVQLVNGIES